MPTVDFTLEDIRQLIDQSLVKEREHTKRSINEALIAEREHTQRSINEALIAEREHTKQMMTTEFNSFWEDNLAPVLQEIQEDITVIKDMVKDHSFRIARLEGRVKRS